MSNENSTVASKKSSPPHEGGRPYNTQQTLMPLRGTMNHEN